jgi:hypothetical protein
MQLPLPIQKMASVLLMLMNNNNIQLLKQVAG